MLAADHFATPVALRDHYRASFGPTIAAYASVADDPDRVAARDRDLLALRAAVGPRPSGERARYGFEYLVVTARRR